MSVFFAGLRFRLVLITFLAAIPALGLILYTAFDQRGEAASHTQQEAMRLARMAAADQKRIIQETHHLLIALTERLELRELDLLKCSSVLTEELRRRPFYVNLGVISADGEMRCSAVPVNSSVTVHDRSYFRQALETKDFTVGGYQVGRITGKASINLGYPVLDEAAEVKAVAFAALDLAWLNGLAASAQLPSGSTISVIDSNGIVMARHPDAEQWIGKDVSNIDIVRTVLTRGEGVYKARGIDGVLRLYGCAMLGDTPQAGFLYVGMSAEKAFSAVNAALIRSLIGLCVILSLALLTAWMFGYLFIVRRVDILVNVARRLAAGDLQARTGLNYGKGEIDQLACVFDEMAERLHCREMERDRISGALKESEIRFRTLVEQLPAIIYTAALDKASTTLYVSPQVEALLGFDPEEYKVDPDLWRKRLHPEDLDRVMAEVARCRDEDDLFICEYRMITRREHVKWFRDEAVIIRGDEGRPVLLQGVMLDITEQKHAQDALRKAHDELEVRVEVRTRELAQANRELREEIAERIRMEAELRGASEKLKHFAYSVIHDLKSPTIGTYGLTKLLQKQYDGALDERGRHYCDQILKASEHVAALVEKINVFIATKETPLRIEELDIREVLDMIRDEFSTQLGVRQIRWTAPEADLPVRADRLCMLRVFRNYVDNALKYGGEQLSEIRIGCEEREDIHIFSVSDNGAGIGQDGTKKIFEMFQRKEASKAVEGSGLGLAIVKEIAERHGGKVWAEPGPIRGTTFYFSVFRRL